MNLRQKYKKLKQSFFADVRQSSEYLKDMPTAGLVEELSHREGVEKIIIEPYEDKEIEVNGPMIILKVMD